MVYETPKKKFCSCLKKQHYFFGVWHTIYNLHVPTISHRQIVSEQFCETLRLSSLKMSLLSALLYFYNFLPGGAESNGLVVDSHKQDISNGLEFEKSDQDLDPENNRLDPQDY
jgi:hypothetical protein